MKSLWDGSLHNGSAALPSGASALRHRNPHLCGFQHSFGGSKWQWDLPPQGSMLSSLFYKSGSLISPGVFCGCLLHPCFYFTQLFPYHQAQIWGWGEVVMVAISSLLRRNNFLKIDICWDSFGFWNFCFLSLGSPDALWLKNQKASACTLPANSGPEKQSCKLNTPPVSQPILHRKEP